MVYSMYTNAGLVTLFYPIAVFGYALLDEVRPSYKFWNVVMTYSLVLLCFKFMCSIEFFWNIVTQEPAQYYIELFKVGLVEYQSFGEMMAYIMPELMIISLIMLNEIKLKLLGLYWETELEIETVNEGIDRTLANGDEEEVQRKKEEKANMKLNMFYESADQQIARLAEYEEIMKEEY